MAAILTSAGSSLDKSMTLRGTLRISGDLYFSGTVIGDIDVNGKLVIAEGGFVEGEVRADVAEIAGTVKGHVLVREHLVLRRPCDLEAAIRTPRIEMEEGARLNGDCRIGPDVAQVMAPSGALGEPVKMY